MFLLFELANDKSVSIMFHLSSLVSVDFYQRTSQNKYKTAFPCSHVQRSAIFFVTTAPP